MESDVLPEEEEHELEDITEGDAADAPAIKLTNHRERDRRGASDIHFEPQRRGWSSGPGSTV